MSYAIAVPTPFNDISELAESFHSRVDEERLMLPCGEMVPEGELVEFAVTLADGSAALQGQGRCTGSFDNGEDRAPEHRFDVVMDSLQLEEMARIYFERILQVRAAYAGDEPQTGETQVPEQAAQMDAAEGFEPELEAAPEGHELPIEGHEPPEAYEAPVEDAAIGEAPAQFDAPDEGTEVAEMTPSQAEAYAEPAAEAAYDDADAALVSGADAYETNDFDGAAAPAFDEAPAEPVADEAFAADVAIDADDLPSEELDSGLIEEAPAEWDESVSQVPSEAPALAVPTASRIYELPAPQAPGALPSPHSQEAVLTRQLLHATWSPQPAARPEPGATTGLFGYAPGAGLPQPASPPRPELDPSQRVAPAPQPGDAYVAPSAPSEHPYAEPAEGYDEQAHAVSDEDTAYEHSAYDESPAEAAEYVADGAEDMLDVDMAVEDDGYGDAGETAAHEAEPYPEAEATAEGDGAHALDYDEDGFDEMQTMDAEAATRQVDVSGLPDDIVLGDETLQVEIPEEESG